MADFIDRVSQVLADRYRVERVVGEGGMAIVFLADDIRHRRSVAVKVLRPELAAALGPERFLQEIEIAAGLDHPHVLPLYDSGEAEGLLYYVMPFVEGDTLRDRIRAESSLPAGDALRILRDVADALGEAHAKGLIHRDVKPANILLSGRHARVADFGVAKALSEATRHKPTTAGVALGTPYYMAPEQASADAETDHRADLFALGVIGYEMLTGERPFTGATNQELFASLLTGTPKPVRELRPDVSEALDAVIMRCLARDPDDRFQTAPDVLTALENAATPTAGVTPAAGVEPAAGRKTGLWIGVAGLAAAALAGVAIFGPSGGVEAGDWVYEEALPEIERLTDAGAYEEATALADSIDRVAPGLVELAELRPLFSQRRSVVTDPPGATVYRRLHPGVGEEWTEAGVTPIDEFYIPRHMAAQIRIELEGYEPAEDLSRWNWTGGEISVTLDAVGSVPDGMVRVPPRSVSIADVEHDLPTFFADRFETTNREYEEFVDAGGYERPEFWEHPFIDGGQVLTWEEAMARFTDQTGRTGPATWEVGGYPDGQADHPVSGISWYEAAAYARFREKELPTAAHFRALNLAGAFAFVIPHANLGSDGAEPVGRASRLSRWGIYDIAGNVREWALNETGGGRHILGGGWNDPSWYVQDATYSQSAWDRSATNGVRLVRYPVEDEAVAAAREPIVVPPVPDYFAMEQPTEVEWEAIRRFYAYDPAPLNATVEPEADTADYWIRERITFDPAYDGQRMVLYLYLPRNTTPPYQPVVYFPGGTARNTASVEEYGTSGLRVFTRAGRAAALPVLQGTFERGYQDTVPNSTTVAYREWVRKLALDVRRTVDYLETRPDMEVTSLGYYGISFGGRMGSVILALEPRFRAGVLDIAGFASNPRLREAQEALFAPRVTQPVRMLSGRYDATFPLETHAVPMFEMLGSTEKDHYITDGGHFVPYNEMARETLDWFDRYLGPVGR